MDSHVVTVRYTPTNYCSSTDGPNAVTLTADESARISDIKRMLQQVRLMTADRRTAYTSTKCTM